MQGPYNNSIIMFHEHQGPADIKLNVVMVMVYEQHMYEA